MSQQIGRAYKQFLKNEKKNQAAMSRRSAAGYTGIASPKNINKKLDAPNTPIQEVERIVSMIRKHSGANNG